MDYIAHLTILAQEQHQLEKPFCTKWYGFVGKLLSNVKYSHKKSESIVSKSIDKHRCVSYEIFDFS